MQNTSAAKPTAIGAGSWRYAPLRRRLVLAVTIGAATGYILLVSQGAYARDRLRAPRSPDKITPTILRLSDAVRPGRSFSINGEGITANAGLDVAATPDLSGPSPAMPPASALHPKIVQTDAKVHFLVATMPAGAAPGVYNIWVKSGGGVECSLQNERCGGPLYVGVPGAQWNRH